MNWGSITERSELIRELLEAAKELVDMGYGEVAFSKSSIKNDDE